MGSTIAPKQGHNSERRERRKKKKRVCGFCSLLGIAVVVVAFVAVLVYISQTVLTPSVRPSFPPPPFFLLGRFEFVTHNEKGGLEWLKYDG